MWLTSTSTSTAKSKKKQDGFAVLFLTSSDLVFAVLL